MRCMQKHHASGHVSPTKVTSCPYQLVGRREGIEVANLGATALYKTREPHRRIHGAFPIMRCMQKHHASGHVSPTKVTSCSFQSVGQRESIEVANLGATALGKVLEDRGHLAIRHAILRKTRLQNGRLHEVYAKRGLCDAYTQHTLDC